MNRRTLLGGLAGVAALGAIGGDLLTAPPAQAALKYGIPPGNPRYVWDDENGVITHDPYVSWQFHLNRTNQLRGGVDLDGDTGDPLFAPIDCTVRHYSGGAGIAVRMYAADGSGWSDVYDHMNRIAVADGTFVPFGGYVGELGATGTSASHLHWHRLDPSGTRRIPWDYFTDGTPSPIASAIVQPVSLVTQSGTIALYAIRGDGNLWGTNQASPGGSFNPWSVIGSGAGNLIGRPSVLQLSSGQIVAYARTSSGYVAGAGQSVAGGSFGAWGAIGANGNGIATDPTAIELAGGSIALYAVTDSGTLAGTNQATPGGLFSGWTTIGVNPPRLDARPSVFQLPSGQIVAYALSTSGMVYGSGQSTSGGAFSAWAPMGEGGGGVISAPTVTFVNGKLSLFAGTSGGYVAYATQTAPGGSFGTWTSTGSAAATLIGAPAVLVTSGGDTVVYARGNDNRTYGTSVSNTSGTSAPWSLIGTGGGGVVSDPTVIQTPSGLLAVYSATDSGAVVGANQSTPGGSFGTWVHA